MTVFVGAINPGQTPGRTQWGRLGPYKSITLVAYSDIGLVDPGFTIAHEWGHSFSLPHDSFRENLMVDSLPLTGVSTFLTQGQITAAYTYAKANF